MLDKLKLFGQNEGYFHIKRIRDFDDAKRDGLTNINTEAIEFDKTAIKLCQEQGQQICKSCDALDIVETETKNKINLIEFKQLEYDEKIKDYIDSLELPQKIKDSREILLNIIRKEKFQHPEKINTFKLCEKNVIISYALTDDSIGRLITKRRHDIVKEKLLTSFKENYIQGENFNEPVAIKLEKFDEEYSSKFR